MRQEEYPAINKAQRLTAERLGPAARSQQCGTDEQQRPLASMTGSHSAAYSRSSGAAADPTIPTASIVQQEAAAGGASKSTWMWDASTTRATVRDHRRSRALATAKAGLQQQQQQQQQHDRRAQTAADKKKHDPLPRSRGRSQTCRSRKAPFPYQRAPNAKPCRREVECLWSDGESSESARSASSSGSQSPPPPLPPPRLGVERARSPERSFLDIGQVIHGIREEARAFDVFLSHEVVPTAQKLFDSAVLHHAKACRLLHKDSLPQLVALESDAAQQGARRRGRSLHKKITAAAAVVVPAADPAAPDDDLPPPPARSASQPRPSRGYLSDSTGASLNVSGNSSTSTNIWLQAVRAGVIEVGPPPTVGSRATLPARRSNAAAAATAAGPIGTIKAQRGPGASAGGVGGAEGRVAKGNGRAKDEGGLEGGAEQEQAREPRNEEIAMGCGGGSGDSGGDGNGNVSSVAGGGGHGSGGDAARQREFPRQEAVGGQDEGGEDDKDEDDEDDLDDDEEEDEGWDVSLSNMVAAEINSKIVGLSSIIRQKAAESAKARRKQVR